MKKTKLKKDFLIFLLISLGIVLLDQISKIIIRYFKPQNISIIKNFFYIHFTTNTGAGFSILQGYARLLGFISLIVAGAIIYFYNEFKEVNIPIAIVFGGIIGNLIDRLFLGAVTDFINFTFWPNFNIADASINIGVFLIIIFYIKQEIKLKKKIKSKEKISKKENN